MEEGLEKRRADTHREKTRILIMDSQNLKTLYNHYLPKKSFLEKQQKLGVKPTKTPRTNTHPLQIRQNMRVGKRIMLTREKQPCGVK
jgi:hypothetical protein